MPHVNVALFAALAVAPAVALLVLWRQRQRRVGWRGRSRTPKRLILVRHGESEGNVDPLIYASVADNALHLTDRGWLQARRRRQVRVRVRATIGLILALAEASAFTLALTLTKLSLTLTFTFTLARR